MERHLLRITMILMVWLAIASQASAQTVVEYVHTDALGSPVAVTNQAGTVIERNDYEPYGAVIVKPSYQGIGYTGHVQDGATGLTYMQQRYYDPQVGLFLSVDPVTAYGSGDARLFNRYAYAFNNPYKFIDPDGRQSALSRGLDKILPPPVPQQSQEPPANNDDGGNSGGKDESGGRRQGGRSPRPLGRGDGIRRDREGNPISTSAPPPPDDDDDQPTRHGQQRAIEARTDPSRSVGDANRVVREGRIFRDSESGNMIYVNGNRVVVTTPEGRLVTQFKNSRGNTAQRISSGKWEPVGK